MPGLDIATRKVSRTPATAFFIITATVLAVATIILTWIAATPSPTTMCPAIYPAPLYCATTNRVVLGLSATLVTLVMYFAIVLRSYFGNRSRDVLQWAGLALLTLGLLITYPLVRSTLGLPLF